MSRRILVTGGAGYIGSHTIAELFETTDFEVISLDSFANSSPKTYDRLKLLCGRDFAHVDIDLCDLTKLKELFSTLGVIDGIIHFAAFKSVPESVDNPYKYYHNNIESLLNLLECCVQFKVRDFIFSSSCSVYGNIKEMPVSEASFLSKAESPYAYTKQIGERIIEDYASKFRDMNFIALRYFNPVGAHPSAMIGEDPINPPTALVPVITKTAAGKIKQLSVFGTDYDTRDGSCIRDYVHVCDIANAHVLALKYLFEKKNEINFDVINLGTGEGVSVFEAIHSFERVSGLKLPYVHAPKREGDVVAIYSDTTKSKKILNWQAKYSLDEMMNSAWNWEKSMI